MKEKIYLIPGLMTDNRLWHRLEPYLSEYDLIHLPIPKSDNFDEISKCLDNDIQCEKINLLGFSLGGYIASYFAIKYPHKVKRLFLVGSTPTETHQKDIEYRKEKLHYIKNNPFIPLCSQKALDLSENKDDETLVKTITSMYNDLGKESLIFQVSSTLKRVNLFETLNNLEVPIKCFYSSHDRLINIEAIEEMKKNNCSIDFIKRDGTSHNIPLETPEHLSFEIKNWMR